MSYFLYVSFVSYTVAYGDRVQYRCRSVCLRRPARGNLGRFCHPPTKTRNNGRVAGSGGNGHSKKARDHYLTLVSIPATQHTAYMVLFRCFTAFLFLHPVHSFILLTVPSKPRLGCRISMSSKAETPKHVMIAGSGMMGIATSYFLAKEFGISSTLVDPSGQVAPAASGKAGGFLARDWNDFSPVF